MRHDRADSVLRTGRLKLLYCVVMLAGRLEVYTLLILVAQSVSQRR